MKEMQRKYSCAVFYVTLVNKNVIKIKSETRSYNQKIQSYKNNPNDDYIQIKEEWCLLIAIDNNYKFKAELIYCLKEHK